MNQSDRHRPADSKECLRRRKLNVRVFSEFIADEDGIANMVYGRRMSVILLGFLTTFLTISTIVLDPGDRPMLHVGFSIPFLILPWAFPFFTKDRDVSLVELLVYVVLGIGWISLARISWFT